MKDVLLASLLTYYTVAQTLTMKKYGMKTLKKFAVAHLFPFEFQCLKKVAKFIVEQNERVYVPRGLLIIDPVERGLRVVSFPNRESK